LCEPKLTSIDTYTGFKLIYNGEGKIYEDKLHHEWWLTNGLNDDINKSPETYRHWYLGTDKKFNEKDIYYEDPDYEVDSYTGQIRKSEERYSIKKILNKKNNDVE
jgi:hypothetical protein